jgi:hypothetical protein
MFMVIMAYSLMFSGSHAAFLLKLFSINTSIGDGFLLY